MSPEHITSKVCLDLRREIYGMIFPRWILILVIIIVAGMIGTLYTLNGRTSVAAANAQKKAENNDTKFSIEIRHVQKGQARLETQFGKQQKLLMAIDKKIPDNGDN